MVRLLASQGRAKKQLHLEAVARAGGAMAG